MSTGIKRSQSLQELIDRYNSELMSIQPRDVSAEGGRSAQNADMSVTRSQPNAVPASAVPLSSTERDEAIPAAAAPAPNFSAPSVSAPSVSTPSGSANAPNPPTPVGRATDAEREQWMRDLEQGLAELRQGLLDLEEGRRQLREGQLEYERAIAEREKWERYAAEAAARSGDYERMGARSSMPSGNRVSASAERMADASRPSDEELSGMSMSGNAYRANGMRTADVSRPMSNAMPSDAELGGISTGNNTYRTGTMRSSDASRPSDEEFSGMSMTEKIYRTGGMRQYPVIGRNPQDGDAVLRVVAATARQAEPVEGAHVSVTRETPAGTVRFASAVTDMSGRTPPLTLPIDAGREYTAYDVRVEADGYKPLDGLTAQLTSGSDSTLRASLEPLSSGRWGNGS